MSSENNRICSGLEKYIPLVKTMFISSLVILNTSLNYIRPIRYSSNFIVFQGSCFVQYICVFF